MAVDSEASLVERWMTMIGYNSALYIISPDIKQTYHPLYKTKKKKKKSYQVPV